MPTRKLLYVINHIDWFWSHRLPLALGARDEGWDVVVGVNGAEGDSKLVQNGFKGAELPGGSLGALWGIHQLLKYEKPDVVHAITIKYAFFTGLAARFHKDVRVVLTLAGLGYLFSGEGIKPKLLRFMLAPFLKLAFDSLRVHVIFQNPDDQDLMIKRGFVRREQCFLIRGSGVDTAEFTVQDESITGQPCVVMPTRLVHDKGVGVFVDAAGILKKRGIDARFQIAGGITRHNPLAISESEIKAMCADGTVEWLGKVQDMKALYASSNLIVYPSYYGEGIPKVLLEAAASGRAIVTTDHPGCREAVRHEYNGILVPIKDAEATADAIANLLEHTDIRHDMASKGRVRAEEEFDVRLIVTETLKVYESAFKA